MSSIAQIWSLQRVFLLYFMMFPVVASAASPLIIAHRGASYDAPENTIEAIRLAWEQGADGVEADFHLSADGQVVCIHDADTQRVAGTKLVVRDTDYETLKTLDVGSWKGARWRDARVPTLEQVLAEIPAGKLVVVELKIGPEIVGPAARTIEDSPLSADQILIISFDADTIAECKRQLPDVTAHWLTSYKQDDDGRWRPDVESVIATLKRSGADGLGSQARRGHFDDKFIERLHEAGFPEYHVWTVDDLELANYYRDLGTRWITTNRPGWLREQVDGAASGE